MTRDASLHDYVVGDLLAGIPGMTSRAMFGGWGIYQNGVFFALIAEGRLYFKVDGTTVGEYQSRGSQPFVYAAAGGKKMVMSYYQLPAEVMEDRSALTDWVDAAVAAAKRAKPKPQSRARR